MCSQRDRGEKVRGRHGDGKEGTEESVTQRERELGETRQRMEKKRKGREERDRQTDRQKGEVNGDFCMTVPSVDAMRAAVINFLFCLAVTKAAFRQ